MAIDMRELICGGSKLKRRRRQDQVCNQEVDRPRMVRTDLERFGAPFRCKDSHPYSLKKSRAEFDDREFVIDD